MVPLKNNTPTGYGKDRHYRGGLLTEIKPLHNWDGWAIVSSIGGTR